MERRIWKGGEATNERLTDQMIEQANAIVSTEMYKADVKERICDIQTNDGMFRILCETDFDYQCYKFKIVGNGVEYLGMEGDFK